MSTFPPLQSTTTSRKRKREVLQWDEVVAKLEGVTVDHDDLVHNLEQVIESASDFLMCPKTIQELICKECLIDGWARNISTVCKGMVSYIAILSNSVVHTLA